MMNLFFGEQQKKKKNSLCFINKIHLEMASTSNNNGVVGGQQQNHQISSEPLHHVFARKDSPRFDRGNVVKEQQIFFDETTRKILIVEDAKIWSPNLVSNVGAAAAGTKNSNNNNSNSISTEVVKKYR